jgi:hypothetical protein
MDRSDPSRTKQRSRLPTIPAQMLPQNTITQIRRLVLPHLCRYSHAGDGKQHLSTPQREADGAKLRRTRLVPYTTRRAQTGKQTHCHRLPRRARYIATTGPVSSAALRVAVASAVRLEDVNRTGRQSLDGVCAQATCTLSSRDSSSRPFSEAPHLQCLPASDRCQWRTERLASAASAAAR